MKKKLTNNLLLKIVSVLIAIVLWLIVANVNDPTISKTYSVPVTITNGAYIESIGKTYRVADEDQDKNVRVTLKGPESIVENRPISDILAVADLTQIVDMDTEPYVMVPIEVTCDKVQPENITVTPQNIRVVLEEVASEEFIIGFDTEGTVPNNEYRVGEITARPEKVKIIGPASVIQKIDRVVAIVNVSGLSEDTMKTSRLKVFDKNQEGLSETSMSYLKFDMGDPVVAVNIELWKVVPEVSIEISYSGTPRYGYHVSSISSTPAKIGIAGTDEALELLKENNNIIEIPAEEVDVSGATDSIEHKVDLTEYLPEGTKIASDTATVIVSVAILPVGSRQIAIPTNVIETTGLRDGYAVVYDTDEVIINVRGDERSLGAISAETLKPKVDLAGREAGVHRIPIEFTLPEGIELLEDADVGIEIKGLE